MYVYTKKENKNKNRCPIRIKKGAVAKVLT